MDRIAPRRQAQIANEKRSKFRELFPSLVAELGISDRELYGFLNEEFDIPLVNFTRGREKSREIPRQSKDDAYDIMKTDDFREKLENRFSALEEPPAEEPKVAAKKTAKKVAKPAPEEKSAGMEAKKPVKKEDLDPDMQDMMGTSAEEPETDYTEEAISLFKNTHATEFDPNSSMDRGKLEKMKSMLAKQGGLGDMSANQFALQVYRNS